MRSQEERLVDTFSQCWLCGQSICDETFGRESVCGRIESCTRPSWMSEKVCDRIGTESDKDVSSK